MKRILIFLLAAGLILLVIVAVAVYIPNTLPVGSDFSALYYADVAFVNGVPIYDIPAMENLAQAHSNIPAENFFMPRFPYPPWYVLSTFYLAWLPIQNAGTLWFELNLIMLFLSIWFLTAGWDGRLRLIAFPLGLIFLPVIGALAVGQYGFPVLLGTALVLYAWRKENVALVTLGTVLLTFKPHIGGAILLSLLVWLIVSGNRFGRRALRSIVLAGIVLALIGLLADPAWYSNYPRMLLNYQSEGNVIACSECANLPVYLSRWFFDGSLARAAQLAIWLLVAFAGIFTLLRKTLLRTPEVMLTFALLMTLIASPYLYNYDFILLLVPFAVIAGGGHMQKIMVLLCHLGATLALTFYGRAGNITLVIAAVLLTLLLIPYAGSQVDVKRVRAYNTPT